MSPAAARPVPERNRRGAMLREMGLGPIWRLRRGDGAEMPVAVTQGSAAGDPVVAAAVNVPVPAPGHVPGPVQATPAAQAAQRQAAAMPRADRPRSPNAAESGDRAARSDAITAVPRAVAPHASRRVLSDLRGPTLPRQPAGIDPDRTSRIATMGWDELEADIRACTACELCERRRQAVPGVGDRHARWMLVGEGPGAEEDQRGEPFVGQAGKLLDNMLAAIGLARGEDVYIANAVKCRPPHNRTPESAELAACLPYLERQIDLVQPELLVALGRPAAQALLDIEVRIGAARGKLFEHRGIPVVVTYHPAYLLRNPQDKARAWEDLCFARRCMREREQEQG